MKIEFDTNWPAKLDDGIYKCKVESVEDTITPNSKPCTKISVIVYSNGQTRTIKHTMNHNFQRGVMNVFNSFCVDIAGKTEVDTRLLVNKEAYCEIAKPDKYYNIVQFIHPGYVDEARAEFNATKRFVRKEDAPIAQDTPNVNGEEEQEDDIPF